MKKRIIIIAIVLAALMLFGFRYMIVERSDVLPDDVRLTLNRFFGMAMAETEPPQPEETPAAAPESTPVPTPEPTPEPVLEKGDSGDEVRAIQTRLRELGFMTGAADGKFGPKTEQAVIEFKKHLHELEQERIAAELAAAQQAEEAEADAADADVETAGTEAEETTEADAVTEDVTAEAAGTEAEETAEADAVTEAAAAEAAGTEAEETAETGADTEAAAAENAGTEAEETAEAGAGMEDVTVEAAENAAGEAEPGAADTEPVFDGAVDEETYRLLAEKGFDEYQDRLSAGSRGAEVRRMQDRLKTLGFLTGKADGIFGKQTAHAVTAFQKQHKLTQDGVAGERTQRALYSSAAKKYVAPAPAQRKDKPYLLKVSTKDQRVYAYSWNKKDGAYTTLARTMVCSTGLASTPTPKGTYKNTTPVVRWGYFPKYDVWAQYLYRISGPYLFHSVLYDEADESTVKWGSVNKLGSPASHGCIRLKVEDARWIYNNCPAGTTVTVY